MQCQKLKTYMETGRVMFLPIRGIRPNPMQPRKVFGAEALDDLCESIRQHGVLQPLSVRRTAGGYELIAGERRLQAAKALGWTNINAVVMDNMNAVEQLEMEIEENNQRKEFTSEELLEGYKRLEKLRNPSVWMKIAGLFKRFFNWIKNLFSKK